MVKEFEFFLKKEVKKQSPDKNLSKSTFESSLDRFEFAKTLKKPKYILENAYEAMREAADALLYSEGYKSYSHQASIAFLSEKRFSESELNEFDRFRKMRNGIKYYGKDCSKEDADTAIKLAGIIIEKIKNLID